MNKYRILIIVILNLVVVNCFAQNEVNKRMYKTAIKQMNAGKYEDATHKFLQYYEQNKNVKKIFPKGRVNNAAFYLGIIKFYHLDYVGANIWFQKVQSRTDFYYYPAFEYLIKSGKAYSEGDFDKAIQYSTMSITKKPKKNYDAYLIRAKSYIAKDNSAKAQKDFDFIIKNGKKSPAKAFALLFTGELRSAVKLMKKLLRKDKKKEYYYNMASIYSYLNSKELALENLEKSIKNGHKYPYYFWKTKDLEEIRDSEEFLNLMQKYNIEKPEVLKSEELEKEMLAFEKTLKTGTVELCNNFIANYPESSKIDTVTYFKNELIAWQISKNDPTREKVEAFLEKYPNSTFKEEAQKLLPDFNKQKPITETKKHRDYSIYCFSNIGYVDNQESHSIFNLYIDDSKVYGVASFKTANSDTGSGVEKSVFYGSIRGDVIDVIEYFEDGNSTEKGIRGRTLILVNEKVLKDITAYHITNLFACDNEEVRMNNIDKNAIVKKVDRELRYRKFSTLYHFDNHYNIDVFITDLRRAVMLNDKDAIAEMCTFPLPDYYGDNAYNKAESYHCRSPQDLSYRYDKIFSEGIKDAIIKRSYFEGGKYNNIKEEIRFNGSTNISPRTILIKRVKGVYKIYALGFLS